MAESVVDLLEPVQVDEQQGGFGMLGVGGGDLIVQQDPVRQTGQVVVRGLVAGPLERPPANPVRLSHQQHHDQGGRAQDQDRAELCAGGGLLGPSFVMPVGVVERHGQRLERRGALLAVDPGRGFDVTLLEQVELLVEGVVVGAERLLHRGGPGAARVLLLELVADGVDRVVDVLAVLGRCR
jgi:hypothetical protein